MNCYPSKHSLRRDLLAAFLRASLNCQLPPLMYGRSRKLHTHKRKCDSQLAGGSTRDFNVLNGSKESPPSLKLMRESFVEQLLRHKEVPMWME